MLASVGCREGLGGFALPSPLRLCLALPSALGLPLPHTFILASKGVGAAGEEGVRLPMTPHQGQCSAWYTPPPAFSQIHYHPPPHSALHPLTKGFA